MIAILDDGKQFLTSHGKVSTKVVGNRMSSFLHFSLEKGVRS